MKKLSILSLAVLVLLFGAGHAMAQGNYAADVGLDGPPFDSTANINVGDQITFDVYLENAPGTATSGGVWVAFKASSDFISYVSSGRALIGGSEGVTGPWDPNAGGIANEPNGAGTLQIVVGNTNGVPPDGNGNIIVARVALEYTGPDDANIRLRTIPGFGTWGPPVNGWDDAAILAATPNPTLVVSQVGGGQVCGDDTVDPPEVCDGENLAGETCVSQGFDGGDLACSGDCLTFDTAACTTDPICGDGIVGPPEVCDGSDLGGETCVSLGFDGGTLACSGDCLAFDTTGCTTAPVCGDDIVEFPEICDGSNLGGETCVSLGFDGGDLACSGDCLNFDTTGCTSAPVCGDGAIESPEICDGSNLGGETCVSLGFDGGTLVCSGDCLAFDTTGCTSAPVCGDDIVESPEICDGSDLGGETCVSLGFDGGDLACSGDCLNFDTTGCTSAPVCGDGTIEPPEVCDGSNLGGETCVSLGFDGGDLACSGDCLAFDTTGCTSAPVCGDGTIEPPEICDGSDLGGETCVSLGFDGGDLACSGDCLNFDTTGCTSAPVCGDGAIESPEICDGSNLGGETCVSLGFDGGDLVCSGDCLAFDTTGCTSAPVCGDGAVEPPEVCDGGNLGGETCVSLGFDGGDLACSGDCLNYDTTGCTSAPVCGDGAIESPEICDGSNLGGETCVSLGFDGGTLVCSGDCLAFDTTGCTSAPVCGDGAVEPPEVCDGGNLGGETCVSLGFDGGDLACSGDCLNYDTTGCTSAPVCGDGVIEPPEICDGSNLGGETCVSLGFDGGDLVCSGDCLAFDTTGCTSAPVCGDGAVEPPEVCDGGNLGGETCVSLGFDGGDLACSGDCLNFDTTGCTSAPVCGDGAVEPPEVCDGGNLGGETCQSQGFDDGDLACSADCGSFDTSECVSGPEKIVSIDIKPGSCPNPLGVKAQGVLPAAILGTDELDVTTIDPDTIMITREGIMGGVSALKPRYKDVGTPFEGELCDCHKLERDGYMDLTLKFSMPQVVDGLKLDEIRNKETIPLTIVGETYDGTPIRGEDCILILADKNTRKNKERR